MDVRMFRQKHYTIEIFSYKEAIQSLICVVMSKIPTATLGISMSCKESMVA